MKLTFQRRLTLSFLIIFVIFTAGVVVFEQGQARRYRTEALEERLDAYAEMIHACVAGDTPDSIDLKVLLPLLPQELRLTVIGASGEVVYDNLFAEPGELDNHAGRPEVANARKQGASYDIRTSASNHIPYIYYAKYFGNDFVRVALPYDVKVKHFLQPDNGFLYFIVILFAVGCSSSTMWGAFSAGRSNGSATSPPQRTTPMPTSARRTFPTTSSGDRPAHSRQLQKLEGE